MNVLSLFDGMSCGQIALQRAGIKVDNYFASEVDKHAIKVTQENWPDTIQIGDVTKVSYENGVLKTENGNFETKIDLVMGGSPCQSWSFLGKMLGADDPRGQLFFDFVRLVNECDPKYFLLENVRMKRKYQDFISGHMGCEPVVINSALVTAQSRHRLYWTNIPNITQPEDRNVVWSDIRDTSEAGRRYCFTDKALKWLDWYNERNNTNYKVHSVEKYSHVNKIGTLEIPVEEQFLVERRGRWIENGKIVSYTAPGKTKQYLIARNNRKTMALTTGRDNVVTPFDRLKNLL